MEEETFFFFSGGQSGEGVGKYKGMPGCFFEMT